MSIGPFWKTNGGIIACCISSVLGGAIAGAGTAYGIMQYAIPHTAEHHIKDFYDVENAVHVSPHSVRRAMDKGERKYTIVDLRSPLEYANEHIVSAINIPAYTDPNTPAYGDVTRIVNAFNALPKDKDTVVYCYSTPCMTGRKIGQILAEHDIYVKHLGIGWNEWKYDWKSWNHEHEWALTKPEDYIVHGKDPGTPQIRDLPNACGLNELGC